MFLLGSKIFKESLVSSVGLNKSKTINPFNNKTIQLLIPKAKIAIKKVTKTFADLFSFSKKSPYNHLIISKNINNKNKQY